MMLPDFISSIAGQAASPAIALFLLPGLVVLAFGIWNHKKISLLALLSSFVLGALIVYPVGFLQLQTWSIAKQLGLDLQTPALKAFVHTAFSEEGAKFLVIVAVCALLARRRADAVGCGLAVGLGFAATENLVYAMSAEDWRSLALSRMATAVPAHAVFGLVMGSLMAGAIGRHSQRAAYGTAALFVPALLHGMYNFPLYVLAGLGSATAGNMWGYGSLFVGTIFIGVVLALTAADVAMQPAPIAADQKPSVRR